LKYFVAFGFGFEERIRLFCPAALALQDGNYVVFPWRIPLIDILFTRHRLACSTREAQRATSQNRMETFKILPP